MRMYAMHITQNPTRYVQAMHELLVLQTVLPRTCTQNKNHFVINELELVDYIQTGAWGDDGTSVDLLDPLRPQVPTTHASISGMIINYGYILT